MFILMCVLGHCSSLYSVRLYYDFTHLKFDSEALCIYAGHVKTLTPMLESLLSEFPLPCATSDSCFRHLWSS